MPMVTVIKMMMIMIKKMVVVVERIVLRMFLYR